MQTELYHCTSLDNLKSILKSGAFYPSYCLEKADYLNGKENFAFAMVCFADLLESEVESHMERFHSSAYLKMNKKWAMSKGLSPVIYQSGQNSPVSACIRAIIDKAIYELKESSEPSGFSNAVNILMAYTKQYYGRYWMDNENKWSEETQFFTEREWRYVPIVKSGEAYYLDSDSYKNKSVRKVKRRELIDNGYTLDFSCADVLEIGVTSEADFKALNYYLRSKVNMSVLLGKAKLLM